MIIKNPTIIIKGSGETLGGEYNIEQIVDGDNCELVITTATGLPENKIAQVLGGTILHLTADDFEGVTEVRQYALDGSPYLVDIEMPEGLISIGKYSFSYCDMLSSVILPNSLQIIGYGAFRNNPSLKSITIPSNVVTIDTQAFLSSGITEMTILATTPPTLTNKNAISSTTITIYIPAGTISAYQTATNWSNYADLFVEMEA